MPAEKPEFEALYRALLRRVYAYVRSQVASAADAEDVTSQVFINAYKAYPRYEPRRASPDSWLFQIARHAIADHHRGRQRRDRLAALLANDDPVERDPAELAEEAIVSGQLWEAVMKLNERQRQALALRHLGLSFAEVAEVLGCSEDAAKMLSHRAVAALRRSLKDGAADA